MTKSRLVLFAAAVLAASHAFAQEPARTTPAAPAPQAAPQPPQAPQAARAPQPPQTPQPAAQPPQPPQPPRREGQPINVKVELTITEEGGSAPPVKKVVNAVAGDGYSGSVREMASGPPGTPPIALNVDVFPVILANGKIRLSCNLQYAVDQGQPQGDGRSRTEIRQNLVLNLEGGKWLVASEAAGPVGDRHVTVEIRATILK